jgi:hypothetical protein
MLYEIKWMMLSVEELNPATESLNATNVSEKPIAVKAFVPLARNENELRIELACVCVSPAAMPLDVLSVPAIDPGRSRISPKE